VPINQFNHSLANLSIVEIDRDGNCACFDCSSPFASASQVI